MISLPVDKIIPELRAALTSHSAVILSADPGAGKTTRVPPALINEPWLAGKKLIMLEPRRLAARRSAEYIAHSMGEKVGETVGYRIRGETAIGKRTRIEIVTEGILTRMLQEDPALQDFGLVIFDEFHERSVHADLGLALALNAQEQLRPDLRLLIMSATLDGIALQSLMNGAPIVRSEGRAFPVETHYLGYSRPPQIDPIIVATIKKALTESKGEGGGDVLVFLPGQREIRTIESLLRGEPLRGGRKPGAEEALPDNVVVKTLFGDASAAVQNDALASAGAGKRKIILATSIAETSLTIEGVRTVVDAGFSRGARFDPRRGMSGLVTTFVSQASADQRRGRAGREAPGTCYRLWSRGDHDSLPHFSQPEIIAADLAPLALELARWGAPNGEGLKFLDPPPPAHLAQAQDLLKRLGAIDAKSKLSPHGRRLTELPLHPRVGHMLVRGTELGAGAAACDVAALLEERDIFRGAENEIDLHSRWFALHHGGRRENKGNGPAGSFDRVREQSARLRKLMDVKESKKGEEMLGLLLALSYPERVAKRREGSGKGFLTAGGTGAILPRGSALERNDYLAIGDVDGTGNEVKIRLAEPLTESQIRLAFGEKIENEESVAWDARLEAVVGRNATRFGAIELTSAAVTPSVERTRELMLTGIRQMGMNVLPWTARAKSVRERSEWIRLGGFEDASWPRFDEAHLAASLESWLGPFLDGISRRAHLEKLDMTQIVEALFTYDQLRRLDLLAPTHLEVPTGSKIALEYSAGGPPVLAVRLQEMFGQTETPSVAGGRVRVLLHLLSPAHRPLAVTQDLPSFWKNAYNDVRKDMRGRYPKHYWPENPLEAEPTRRTKRR